MAKKKKKALEKKAAKKPVRKALAKKEKRVAKPRLEEPQILEPVSESRIVEWLSPQRQIDLKLQRHLQDLPKAYILLALIRVQEYSATNLELIKYFLKKKVPGVFVSINKPLEDLAMEMPKELLQQGSISFIDCISRMSGAEELSGKNFLYIDSPSDLVQLTVMLENVANKISSGEKFVVIDSISTLLIYNKPEVVEKFVHSIAGKMRTWKVKGILVMVESSETKPIAEALGQFCDRVVKIE